jgi:hypothetical protein
MSLARPQTRSESSISRDVAFEILNCCRRRQVLRYLLEHTDDRTAELYDITRQIAAWENDNTVEEVTSTQRMRVYTALRQSHLPMMDDRGVIEYDKDRGHVALTDEAPKLVVYMDTVPHQAVKWARVYLSIGSVSLLLLTTTALGVYPFSLVPVAIATAAIIAVFLVVAVVHATWDRRLRSAKSGDVHA